MPVLQAHIVNTFEIKGRWSLHSYYTLCPYAPDDSGRILLSGTNLDTVRAEVIILSADGKVLNRFGSIPTTPSFWHTGLWQSWSPDAKMVYYQSGTLNHPNTTRYNLETGEEQTVPGEIEGMPPSGEPAFSCSHGMLYAAGYGGNRYNPDASPVPFQSRAAHGISSSLLPPTGWF